ncbi:MAG: HEAT repeat domain-containing protein, partial [Saprospiraceae bacterium]|nr:HEAT repeat domain-containing protein [Saprospiraceae bacterium]
MRRYVLPFLGLVLLTGLVACVPPDQNNSERQQLNLDLTSKPVQRVYNLRDEGQTDSLVAYLSSENATLRYLAALAFASVRDSNAIEPLVTLLQDPLEEVRMAAAFALGQIGSPRAEQPLANAFQQDDSLSQHQRFNAIVLEAVGKCGGKDNLRNIAAVASYYPSDTLLLEGQCRAIYRYGLRNIVDPAATARMIGYVTNERIPQSARQMAAHYLARTKDIAPDSLQAVQLASAFVRSTDPKIRMALARALGKSQTEPAFAILSKVIKTEQDWRVKCDLIQALAKFEYDTVRALVSPFVLDANQHVSRTAAEFFVANGQQQDGDYYWRIARDNPNLPWPSRIALYRASYKWMSGRTFPEKKEYLNYRLRDFFLKSPNPYERAACLQALSEFAWQFRWIHDKGLADSSRVVKTAAVEALAGICERPDFYQMFGENGRNVRRELYYNLREIVNSGQADLIAATGGAFCAEAMA